MANTGIGLRQCTTIVDQLNPLRRRSGERAYQTFRSRGGVMHPFAVAALVVGVLTLGGRAQTPVPQQPPSVERTTVGSELFKFYCSNCHGLDAKGRPATSTMRLPASDLTVLSIRNGGLFPLDRVRAIISLGAGDIGSHGTTDMPVWGTIFRALEPNDALVALRIGNLVRYIESLQVSRERASASETSPATLVR